MHKCFRGGADSADGDMRSGASVRNIAVNCLLGGCSSSLSDEEYAGTGIGAASSAASRRTGTEFRDNNQLVLQQCS